MDSKILLKLKFGLKIFVVLLFCVKYIYLYGNKIKRNIGKRG